MLAHETFPRFPRSFAFGTRFPALPFGTCFSRRPWLHVFPHLVRVKRFPALFTDYKISTLVVFYQMILFNFLFYTRVNTLSKVISNLFLTWFVPHTVSPVPREKAPRWSLLSEAQGFPCPSRYSNWTWAFQRNVQTQRRWNGPSVASLACSGTLVLRAETTDQNDDVCEITRRFG